MSFLQMDLLQMSFAGAVIILAIILIRALAINRLPKKTFLALWGVALIRLLMPFSLPSVFSVYSWFRQNKAAMNTMNAAVNAGPMVIDRQVITVPVIPSSDSMVHISVWTIIWAIGVFICALIFSVAYWKCYQEFRRSKPVENDFTRDWLNAHKQKRVISVRQSARISAPLTYGVFHPVILMPETTDWSNEKSLRYVLEHEYVHIKRFDTLVKLILIFTLCIHWFNPLVWAMYVLANRDIELACDEAVVRLFGEKMKSSYARVLISMEEMRSRFTPMCNNFSKNSIEERIIAIMKIRKTTTSSLVLSCVIVAGTAIIFATSASASDGQVSQNTDSAMTETALLRLEKNYPDVARRVRECYPDAVWWTYEGYQQTMEDEMEALENSIGEYIGWTPSAGDIVVTRELIEERRREDEQILEDLSNGIMVSKSIDGDENCGTSFDPADIYANSSRTSDKQDSQETEENNVVMDDAAMTETALLRLEKNYPDVARWARECYPDAVWWTYEGYEQMMNTGMGDKQTLEDLRNGIMVSKSIGGDENCGGSFDPADIAASTGTREYECSIFLNDGTEKVFGPYEDMDEMLSVVKPFCEEQAKLGNLSQSEAEEIIQRYMTK